MDDDPALELATNLLGLPKADFKKWTIKKQIMMRSEKIVSALGSAQAIVVRDSVAKFVYSCLFDVSSLGLLSVGLGTCFANADTSSGLLELSMRACVEREERDWRRRRNSLESLIL